MDKNKIVPIVIIIAVLVAVGFFMFRGNKTIDAPSQVASTDVVATVNGVAISKTIYDTQLASAVSSLKTQGQDVESADKLTQIKDQVLNDLISKELITQGIASAGIKVSSEEVEKQFQDIITQTGGADKFKEELTKANMTEDQLRQNISEQLVIQQYLSANVDINGIIVSDEEISKLYDEYSKAQIAAGQKEVPALKDLSEQIKQQIVSDKQNVLVNNFIASLLSKDKVVKSI